MIEVEPKSEALLRDFVYLDWERVRSLSAQLLGGVPQDATKESGHDLGTGPRVATDAVGEFSRGGAYFQT